LDEYKTQKLKKMIAPVFDIESDNKISVQVISIPKKRVVKKLCKRSSDTSDVNVVQKEFQKKLKWLKVNGDLS
jgi:aspartokinase